MYQELFNASQQRTIQSDGRIFIPQEHEHEAHTVIPDHIVHFCIHYFRLINSSCKVIDPLCGLGSIPRVFKEKGGKCLGVEIDNDRYKAAARLVGENTVIRGDFLTAPFRPHSFDCIFTSFP